MITKNDITHTYLEIKDDLHKTPLVFSPQLSMISEAKVYLKMEHFQKTGSFKLRGVLSKMKSLNTAEFDKTFVAASTGNHAAAFGHASKEIGFKAILFLPENTSKSKIEALDQYGMDIRYYGKSSSQTERKARDHAESIDGVLIHPYNDWDIIKGQGTLGAEIDDQLDNINAVLAPIGGGGLISGICVYFEGSKTNVIGCQPINGAEMYESIQENRIVSPSALSTISDATSGGIEDAAVTFDICKKHLSGIELIDEVDIRKAVAFVAIHHESIIEPAAALPIAALLKSKKYKGKTVVLILTGKKIDRELLNNIMKEYGDNY